ncbi:gastric mucin-like protein [Hirsutella rhossiliensis]|uniref:Gastric mucin-like protein n=1 Tax=Hirsutella rhossiliensis TaxID=111463 RepID=A0A9P8MR53_9HYPO|nr:gastric mucin-like protein [Hirsutella rhossiliensis]KAH0960733.1 gastric mucin-like protein [Hirsutella rhossiliensis]
MAHHETELLGSIVAFEGRPDTISTQLRLLPTSSQVLILPSVQCNFPNVDLGQNFDARAYVKRVHDALVARNEAARTFLQASTPTNKRLVFMNGGTPSAQALCIKAIMMHETAGDRAEAGAIFDDLIKDGVAGLHEDWHRRSAFDGRDQAGDFEDPITRAMRAADALDRQTASLQPSDDLDLTVPTRQRSSSLPLYGYSDAFGDAAPFFVFGARTAEKDGQVDETCPTAPRKPSLAVPQSDDPAQKPTLLNPWNRVSIPYSPSCIGESYEPSSFQERIEVDASSPMSDVFSIQTLDNVVYGEASVLDVRHSVSGRGSLARVKSLDRIYPASPKFRDLCIPSESWLAEPETPRPHRPQSLMVFRDDKDAPWSRLSIVERPRTVMVRSKMPIVKVAPVPQGKKKRKRHVRARSTYVDRGTDPDAESDEQAPFQPVFPLTEDLVVFLKEETADGLLESAVGAFRDGHYPLLPLSPKASEPIEDAEKSLPGTPSSRSSEAPRHCNSAPEPEEDMVAPASANLDDYDPFAYIQPTAQAPKPSPMAPKVTVVRPPTPAHTPPPSVAVSENERKVHEFSIATNQTAVAVQNSLRSILAEYFPPDTQGYHQFQFSLLPEFDGLWKPIFRGTETDSPQKGEGNIHQILAIGSQKGVKKEYSLAITGQLERLGSKSSDLGRADIVDFRYLLANAMQAFTAQPLANQTSDNPFTNSYLLATLIVPHLETYLALHCEVRYLLLQYPPEHLGTVLALQKLVGVDLMKVAQIVDSNSKEHLPFTHIRGVSIGSKSEANPGKRSSPSPSPSPAVPVSKANFLLTSTASDKDIAKFVSTVWNIPADFGDSETPESSILSSSKRKARPSPLQLSRENLSPFPKVSPQSPVSPKTVVASPPMRDVPPSAVRPTSAAESVRTSKSGKSKQSRRKSRGNTATPAADTASIMSYDPAEESDLDFDERRLIPLFLRKTGTRKPNSRKALKFLGLA